MWSIRIKTWDCLQQNEELCSIFKNTLQGKFWTFNQIFSYQIFIELLEKFGNCYCKHTVRLPYPSTYAFSK